MIRAGRQSYRHSGIAAPATEGEQAAQVITGLAISSRGSMGVRTTRPRQCGEAMVAGGSLSTPGRHVSRR